MRTGRRLRTEQVQQLLIASALSLIVSACSLPVDRETRAYNVCVARHPQEAAVCEGPRQAYEVDASDIPARATASSPGAGYLGEGGSAGAGSPLKPVPLTPDRMPVTSGPNGQTRPEHGARHGPCVCD
jgi:hypothetical protein